MPNLLTTEEFIKRSKQAHGEKYDYSESVYSGHANKVKIQCFKHGFFLQRAGKHMAGEGCLECGRELCGIKNSKRYKGNKKGWSVKLTKEEFIKKAMGVHGHRYDYSLLEYNGYREPIDIICKIHGKYTQTASHHLYSGCPDCGAIKASEKNTISFDEFCKRANKKHENKYIYYKDGYSGSASEARICCPIHGDYTQSAYAHLRGQGCKKCRVSKGERRIRKWLKKNNIKFDEQKKFEGLDNSFHNDGRKPHPLFFDFYLTDYNLLIEFDGKQHFYKSTWHSKPEETLIEIKKRDKFKNNWAKENNINLIRFSYKQMDKLEECLNEEILEKYVKK